LRLIADRASCCLSNRACKLKGVNVAEVLVIFAGSWDHNVWYGVHVCPRWTGTPKVSCRAYCRRSLPPKGCSCTSGTSLNSLNFCFVLISYVQLSNVDCFGSTPQHVALGVSCADRVLWLGTSFIMQIFSVAYHTDFFSVHIYSRI
jgi:hypothetical protein